MTHYVRDHDPTWKEACTLEECVAKLLEQGKTSKDPEFKALLAFWGKEKIVKIVEAYKGKKRV